MSDLSSVTAEIKQRVFLSDFLSTYVRLIRKGHKVMALCPFHKEKTPSFYIDDDKGSYHCFGCGKHGDHFSFLVEQRGMSFPEALKVLADLAGINLPEKNSKTLKEETSSYQQFYRVMEDACCLFQSYLQTPEGEKARYYLQSRQMQENSIQKFRLGYAPRGSKLVSDLKNKGYSERILTDVGLLNESRYERFQNRIIFPIADSKGRIIAFGGRALESDQMPKYLNSPDTPLFHKSKVLYAQHLAFPQISKEAAPLIVEGYMDVISVHQFGHPVAIAPLGTSLTEEHIQILWKRHSCPIFCFDGDQAGRKAAFRAAEKIITLLKTGYSAKFCFLPAKHDPDSFLKERGLHQFKALLASHQSLSDTLWQYIHTQYDLVNASLPEEKAKAKKYIDNLISEIKDNDLKSFFQKHFNFRFYALNSPFEHKKVKKNINSPSTNLLKLVKNKLQIEKILLATLKNHPILIERVFERVAEIENLPADLDAFRCFLLENSFESPNELSEKAKASGLEKVIFMLDNVELRSLAPFALCDSEIERAYEGWQDMWNQHYHKKRIYEEKQSLKMQLKQELNTKTWQQWQQMKVLQTDDQKYDQQQIIEKEHN